VENFFFHGPKNIFDTFVYVTKWRVIIAATTLLQKFSKMGSRQIMFTVNNYTEEDKAQVIALQEFTTCMRVGMEVGKHGTPHLQCAMTLSKPQRFSWLRKKVPRSANHQKMKAPREGFLYCCKGEAEKWDDEPIRPKMLVEQGFIPTNRSHQGRRSDLGQVLKKIKTGSSWAAIYEEHPGDMLRYNRGFREYKFVLETEESKKFRVLDVSVYYGETNTGKTRKAVAENPDAFFMHASQLKKDWWNGYEGQRTLILDEYDSQVPCSKMLQILDGYQHRLPTKGGHTWALWTKVILTSNLAPSLWHPQAKPVHKKALARRITRSIRFGGIKMPEKPWTQGDTLEPYCPDKTE